MDPRVVTPDRAATRRAAGRTLGVEEEFLLLGPDGRPRAGADATVGSARRAARGADDGRGFARELKEQQVESGTAVCSDLADLATETLGTRHQLAGAAAAQGLRLAALGTSPFPVGPTNISDERAAGMTATYGLPAQEMLCCGCHVHVSVSSRAEGVTVLDRIRPWLPALRALSANSPYWQGQDTGYASYRTLLWNRLPTAGPGDPFGSVAVYEDVVRSLVASGSALDRGTIYFDARLSDSYPTVEIRVADAVPTVADVVLLAALCRGLVETAAAEAAAGVPAPRGRVDLLRAAAWRAARSGLSEDLIDPTTDRRLPAHEVVASLVSHVRAALTSYGDERQVATGLEDLARRGTGADLQRHAFRRRGRLVDVVDDAAAWTLRR